MGQVASSDAHIWAERDVLHQRACRNGVYAFPDLHLAQEAILSGGNHAFDPRFGQQTARVWVHYLQTVARAIGEETLVLQMAGTQLKGVSLCLLHLQIVAVHIDDIVQRMSCPCVGDGHMAVAVDTLEDVGRHGDILSC